MKLHFLVCVLAVATAEYANNQIYDTNGYGENVHNSFYVPSGANIHAGSFVQNGPVTHGSAFTSGGYPGSDSSSFNSYVTSGHENNVHVPIIKDGVPVDTPEVQKARAEHFELYNKAAAAAAAAPDNDGYYREQGYSQVTKTQAYYPTSIQSSGTYNNGYNYEATGYRLTDTGIHTSDTYNQIGPVDTPEVQQAKAAHFAAFAKAAARATHNKHYRYRRGLDYIPSHNLYGSQLEHVPIITKEGVPVETPEVQAAKAQHLLAHSYAKSRSGSYDNTHSFSGYGLPQSSKVQYSIIHQNTYGGWPSYQGVQHFPQLDKNGVPVETPEVQAAKQQHFLAHSYAKLNSYGQNQDSGLFSQPHISPLGSSFSHQGAALTPNGVPEETPEVKLAKAQHLLAHAQEQAKHTQWAGQAGYGYGNGYSLDANYGSTSSHY